MITKRGSYGEGCCTAKTVKDGAKWEGMDKLMIKEDFFFFQESCPAWPPRFEQSFTVKRVWEIDSIKISRVKKMAWVSFD